MIAEHDLSWISAGDAIVGNTSPNHGIRTDDAALADPNIRVDKRSRTDQCSFSNLNKRRGGREPLIDGQGISHIHERMTRVHDDAARTDACIATHHNPAMSNQVNMILNVDEVFNDEPGSHPRRGNEGLKTSSLSNTHSCSNLNELRIVQPEWSLEDGSAPERTEDVPIISRGHQPSPKQLKGS